jgi:hypothetical protein
MQDLLSNSPFAGPAKDQLVNRLTRIDPMALDFGMAIPDWKIVQEILDQTGSQSSGVKAREIVKVLGKRIRQRERQRLSTEIARHVASENSSSTPSTSKEEAAWYLTLGRRSLSLDVRRFQN